MAEVLCVYPFNNAIRWLLFAMMIRVYQVKQCILLIIMRIFRIYQPPSTNSKSEHFVKGKTREAFEKCKCKRHLTQCLCQIIFNRPVLYIGRRFFFPNITLMAHGLVLYSMYVASHGGACLQRVRPLLVRLWLSLPLLFLVHWCFHMHVALPMLCNMDDESMTTLMTRV